MNQRITNCTNLIVAVVALASTVTTVVDARAQIYNNRVVDKAFEENTSFFQPSRINPYDLSGFGDAAPGLVAHPLLDLQVNPALALSDSVRRFYGYLDFRRADQPQPEGYYYRGCPYCLYASDVIAPYPYPYLGGYDREPLRPILSASLLGRPFEPLGRLVVGMSYQLTFRDEKYYQVPYDIYRSNARYDFTGSPVAEGSAPIVDGSSGEDAMRTIGHALSLHLSREFGKLNAGGRIGFESREIDGSLGYQNAWTSGVGTPALERSLWSNLEERSQTYRHVDLELGAMYDLSGSTRIGVTAGALLGSADQVLVRTDTSYYDSNIIPPSPDVNRYVRGGRTDQLWNRDGGSTWLGLNLIVGAGSGREGYVIYRGSRLSNDLLASSAIRDSSFSTYISGIYASTNTSSLVDIRTGTGDRSGSSHRFSAGVRWDFAERSRLHVGIDLQQRSMKTTVTDIVESDQHAYNYWESTDPGQTWNYAIRGAQELAWKLESRSVAITIPVFMSTQVSNHVQLEFGLNRRIELLDLSDQTTVYNLRLEETNNGQRTNRDGTKEVYREPKIRDSDISTSFLAGVRVAPTRTFDVRMLVAPVYREMYGVSDLQWRWWVGFEFTSP